MGRVLVACEFSGKVRDAFARAGHDAWSCDLLPTEASGNHFQGDAIEFMNSQHWDLLIAHPPCTYLSYAGTGAWNKPGREEKRKEAFEFFMKFVNAPIEKICVENPVGWQNKIYKKPDQIIHPYMFGDRHLKRTCLWLKNLPVLWWWKQDDLFGKQTATEYPEPMSIDNSTRKKKRYFTDHFGSGYDHERSKTFPGIAQAMADQWSKLL